ESLRQNRRHARLRTSDRRGGLHNNRNSGWNWDRLGEQKRIERGDPPPVRAVDRRTVVVLPISSESRVVAIQRSCGNRGRNNESGNFLSPTSVRSSRRISSRMPVRRSVNGLEGFGSCVKQDGPYFLTMTVAALSRGSTCWNGFLPTP